MCNVTVVLLSDKDPLLCIITNSTDLICLIFANRKTNVSHRRSTCNCWLVSNIIHEVITTMNSASIGFFSESS